MFVGASGGRLRAIRTANRSLVDESDGIATGLADDCKPMGRAIFDVFDGSLSWVLAVTHHSAVRHARGLPFAVTVTFATATRPETPYPSSVKSTVNESVDPGAPFPVLYPIPSLVWYSPGPGGTVRSG